jgi:hypothetical protein
MKSLQTVMLLAVIVGAVAGITFIRHWLATPVSEKDAEPTPSGTEVQLDFPAFAIGAPQVKVGDCLTQTPGHYDFWFRNPNDSEVEVGLDVKSCKCTKIDVLTLTPEQEKRWAQELPAAAAAPVFLGTGGFLNVIGAVAASVRETDKLFGRDAAWKGLEVEVGSDQLVKQLVPIPARASGAIRLHWAGKDVRSERFTAVLWAQARGDPKTRGRNLRLDVALNLVPPILVDASNLKLPRDLQPGEQCSTEFYCWSTTRAGFGLSAREEYGDPCFTFACTPLTGAEFQKVSQAFVEEKPPRIGMLCLYRVRVSVHERLPDGHQLDLGPFRRNLILTTDQDDHRTFAVQLEGMVRGEITVGAGEQKDRINFKSFAVSRGVDMAVPVESSEAGLRLAVESKNPDYLQVELNENTTIKDGLGHWQLKVTVPPGQAAGPLPHDSAVVLKTQSQPPRRIRIPVLGNAIIR